MLETASATVRQRVAGARESSLKKRTRKGFECFEKVRTGSNSLVNTRSAET